MKESSLQGSVLNYLNGLSGCIAENVSGNAHQSGRPDINGCFNKRAFRIELKVGRNKPSKKQFINLLRWHHSGAIICVAYSMEDIYKFVENINKQTNWYHIGNHIGKNTCSFGIYRKGEKVDEFFKQYQELYLQD